MENLLLDVIEYMIAQGVVTGANIDTFTDYLPDTPHNAIGLYEYAGTPAFIGDFANRSISVQVRNKSHENGRVKIQSIYNLFHKEEMEDSIIMLTATRWSIIHCRSTPSKLRVDESKRTIFVFNMGVLTSKDE